MQGSPVWLLALAWSGRPACLHPRGNDHLECGDFVAAFFLPSLRPPRLAASPLECGDSSPPSFFPSLRAPHPAASPLECGDLSPPSFFPSPRSHHLAANRPRAQTSDGPITARQNPHSLFARYLRKLAPIVSTSVRKSSSRSLLPSASPMAESLSTISPARRSSGSLPDGRMENQPS